MPHMPPVSYHFRVEFDHPEFREEAGFQSVSGLQAQLNRSTTLRWIDYLLGRKSGTYTNLVLKRGLLPESDLTDWCMATIHYNKIQPVNLRIDLLDKEHNPLTSWKVHKAYPVQWSVSEFHAERSELAIERIELSYQWFDISSDF